MKKKIDVFIFIDALGWEITQKHQFLADILPYRNPAQMVFGYSSTAIPTILTGEPPEIHKHLSFYYYNPEKSPFKLLKYLQLRYLPSRIFDRWRVRHTLSKIIAKLYKFTGYFEMYSMPFDRIHLFDYIEKKDIFLPGGMEPVANLADILTKAGKPHHISNWRLSEQANFDALNRDISQENIEFAFLYTAAMDGLLHVETKDGAKIPEKLKWYEERIKDLIQNIKQHYEDFTLHVISDHGMTTLTGTVDLKKIIHQTGLKFGKDYAAVFDSTMLRLWYLNDNARDVIRKQLETCPDGHIMTLEEKIQFRINFEDHMYGEDIFLLNPGIQIEPCDMGLKALPGMHGYSPLDKDSYASYLSTHKPEVPPEWVGDFFKIMKACVD
jgi:predicted AlkP superfamily pyrophosphatase or phosphodiesterase